MKPTGAKNLEAVIDSNPISRYQTLVIVICALIAMLDGFDTQSIAFVASEIATAWKVEPSVFGPVFGAGLLGGLAGAVVLGPVGDRFGRKPTLLGAILVFAIGSLMTPLTESVLQLIAIRFITGLGLGGAMPCFISLTSEYAPKRLRSTLVGLMFCGFPIGAVIGGLASSKLIPVFGWSSVFIAGGVLPLLILPLLIVYMPESVRFLALKKKRDDIARILERMNMGADWNGELAVSSSESRAPIKSLFTQGRATGTVLLWIALFFSLMLTYFLVNWIPILGRRSGLTIEASVIAVALLNLGAVIGCLIIGRLADRFNPAIVIGIAYALGAAAITYIGHAGQSGAMLGSTTFVAGVLSIGAQMCTVALCAAFYDTFLRATGVGWAMGVGRIGAMIGPVLGGVMLASGVEPSSLFAVAGATSALTALAVFAIGWLVPSARQHGASEVSSSQPNVGSIAPKGV